MAQFFWQQGGNAIPNALLASKLCIALAERPELQDGAHSDTVKAFAEMSDKFEDLAIGVMSACYDEDGNFAQAVLEDELISYEWLKDSGGGYYDSLELAKQAKNENFIAHPACQVRAFICWLIVDVSGGINHVVTKKGLPKKLMVLRECTHSRPL